MEVVYRDTIPTEIPEAALAYAALGLPVFKLRAGMKSPLRRSHGCKDATLNQFLIEDMFPEHPEGRHCNIGLATGTVVDPQGLELEGYRRVIVVDDDCWKNPEGVDYVAQWQQETGRTLPPTLCQKTAHGGYQFFYDDPKRLIRKGGARESVHIDIRADGGYVVVAPSKLEDGGAYEWVYDPWHYGISEVNDDVLAFYQWWVQQGGRLDIQAKCEVTPKGNVPHKALTADHEPFAFPAEGVVQEGGRRSRMFSFASYLRSRGLDEDSIRVLTNIANKRLCAPPMLGGELGRVIYEASKYEPGSAKWLDNETAVVIRQFALSMFRKNVPADVVLDLAIAFAMFNVSPDINEGMVTEIINDMLRAWGAPTRVGGE